MIGRLLASKGRLHTQGKRASVVWWRGALVAACWQLVGAPDTVGGANTRWFTLVAASDGSWQVVQLGDTGSCSLGEKG